MKKAIEWFETIDWITVLSLFFLLLLGITAIASTSFNVANRLDIDPSHFLKKQLIFVLLFAILIVSFSMLGVKNIKFTGFFGLGFTALLLMLLPFYGEDINGSVRWIRFFGVSIQPSEVVKPFFIITNAFFLELFLKGYRRALVGSLIIIVPLAFLILLQPDIGSFLMFTSVGAAQIFMAGISLIWILPLIPIVVILFASLYFFYPHFNLRINSYIATIFMDSNLDKQAGYQANRALDAISSGGLYGTGIFEGTAIKRIPEVHNDFIFAAISEELGFFVAMSIILVYVFFAIRKFLFAYYADDYFIKNAIYGLTLSIILNVFFSIGVNLSLLPTKGINLPLLSYGGSSMISAGLSFGYILALSRYRNSSIIKRINIIERTKYSYLSLV